MEAISRSGIRSRCQSAGYTEEQIHQVWQALARQQSVQIGDSVIHYISSEVFAEEQTKPKSTLRFSADRPGIQGRTISSQASLRLQRGAR